MVVKFWVMTWFQNPTPRNSTRNNCWRWFCALHFIRNGFLSLHVCWFTNITNNFAAGILRRLGSRGEEADWDRTRREWPNTTALRRKDNQCGIGSTNIDCPFWGWCWFAFLLWKTGFALPWPTPLVLGKCMEVMLNLISWWILISIGWSSPSTQAIALSSNKVQCLQWVLISLILCFFRLGKIGSLSEFVVHKQLGSNFCSQTSGEFCFKMVNLSLDYLLWKISSRFLFLFFLIKRSFPLYQSFSNKRKTMSKF